MTSTRTARISSHVGSWNLFLRLTEQVASSKNVSGLHSGGRQIESLLEHRVSEVFLRDFQFIQMNPRFCTAVPRSAVVKSVGFGLFSSITLCIHYITVRH
jgi:hypothetical protein